MRSLLRAGLVAAAVVAVTVARGPAPAGAAGGIPAHVFAPYFESWTTDGITAIAQASGAKYLTLAFLETTSKTSCTLTWDGDSAQPVSGGKYLSDIASLRGLGGDVIPSFGGWSADQGGTEIGDSCKDVNTIAAAYESLVTTYGVTRLDFDIEGRSLTKTDGIDRRNKAIKVLQDWAGVTGRKVEIQYTLPTSRTGLESTGVAILQNAALNGVRVDLVNPMVFDYYDRATTAMGTSAISALEGLHSQLHSVYPAKTDTQLWAMEAATIMNGLDDYPRKTELTTVADAQQLVAYAQSKGMTALSMWAIERDNGGCPGSTGSNNCSGIAQGTWDFSHAMAPFSAP